LDVLIQEYFLPKNGNIYRNIFRTKYKSPVAAMVAGDINILIINLNMNGKTKLTIAIERS
jgi:hypothetical protein